MRPRGSQNHQANHLHCDTFTPCFLPLATSIATIRVGLIGLASVETTTMRPHGWAVVSSLSSFIHSPEYDIVAACNSTTESARRAIDLHKLPEATKT
ncbi:oxidoreductase [Ilyonectria robusta]